MNRLLWCAVLWLMTLPAQAGEIHAAVAANFSSTFDRIAAAYTEATGVKVLASYASSGKLYAQISHGAPFELFLSADVETPRRLEQEGQAVVGTRFTYAVGALVLWSAQPGLVDAGGGVLRDGKFKRLAIASPRTAPYGLAAQQVLTRLGLWETLKPRLVEGENIAQTFQFVGSGNAQLGFVALSQTQGQGGSAWRVPQALYEPIEQQVVILKRGQDKPDVRKFHEFLRGERAAKIIAASGYGVAPEGAVRR